MGRSVAVPLSDTQTGTPGKERGGGRDGGRGRLTTDPPENCHLNVKNCQ